MAMELVKYDIDAVAIQGLKEKYLDIVILPDDKASYAMVMAGQKECREIRKTVDEWHKEKKADIIKAGKHYDSEKNRVYDALDPIESHLKTVRKAEDDRVAKIEAERIARIQARIAFITQTAAVGYNETSEIIQGKINAIAEFVIDDTLEEFAFEAETKKESALMVLNIALTKRLQFEKEEADRAAEKTRLEQVAKDQEAERQRQAEAQKVIDTENVRLKAEADKIEQAKRNADNAIWSRRINYFDRAYTRISDGALFDTVTDACIIDKEELITLDDTAFQPFVDKWNFLVSSRETEEKDRLQKEADDLAEKKLKDKQAADKLQAEKDAAEAARVAALAPDKTKIINFARSISQLISAPPEIKDKDLKIAMDARLTAISGQVTQLLKIAGA